MQNASNCSSINQIQQPMQFKMLTNGNTSSSHVSSSSIEVRGFAGSQQALVQSKIAQEEIKSESGDESNHGQVTQEFIARDNQPVNTESLLLTTQPFTPKHTTMNFGANRKKDPLVSLVDLDKKLDVDLTFEDWLKLMPASSFPNREEWEVNDMLFRLEEIIIYAKNYLMETTYPNGPSQLMLNKEPEEYKQVQRENQITVSLCRDLMECVDIFKKIPVPQNN